MNDDLYFNLDCTLTPEHVFNSIVSGNVRTRQQRLLIPVTQKFLRSSAGLALSFLTAQQKPLFKAMTQIFP